MARFTTACFLALGVTLSVGVDAKTSSRHKSPPAEKKQVAPESTEDLLQKIFDEIGANRFDAALKQVDRLIAGQPNFRLAHLIRGDLLIARVKPLTTVGSIPGAHAEKVGDLRAEAIARLRALRERPAEDQVPRYLLQLPADQKYAVVVDTSRSRLYLYENNLKRTRLVKDFYISIGKQGAVKAREGDQKTPIGAYYVTSSVPRKKLTDFYGSGAFPINYPNEWDKRQGRNGHGIWLHGTPSDTYARPPRASDGCVVLSNADLDALANNLQIGKTQVVISEKVEWRSQDELANERKEFMTTFDRWRADWESLETSRFLEHYSKSFRGGGMNFSDWSEQKRKVNGGKSWIKVGVTNLSVIRSPGQDDLMIVTFDQDYRSNNLNNVMRKQQYWLREGGRWRVVYEGAA